MPWLNCKVTLSLIQIVHILVRYAYIILNLSRLDETRIPIQILLKIIQMLPPFYRLRA